MIGRSGGTDYFEGGGAEVEGVEVPVSLFGSSFLEEVEFEAALDDDFL
jgi:hypothetical protein